MPKPDPIEEYGHRHFQNPPDLPGLHEDFTGTDAARQAQAVSVVASVYWYAVPRKRDQCVLVAAKASCPEAARPLRARAPEPFETYTDQQGLFVKCEVTQMLALAADVRQQGFAGLVYPLSVQMQLHFLLGILDQPYDLFERLQSEALGKQGLDEKHTDEAMLIEQAQLEGKAVVSSRSQDIPSETVREPAVHVVPAIAPYLDVDRKINRKHAA
jgi:hypothetical protein